MAANNKQIENRVKQLMAMGIAYPQAVAIANSEIPTMEIGGNIDPNYLQNLEDESYQLDEEYRLLQSEQGLEWAQGIQAETDRIKREEAEKYDKRNQALFDNYMEEADRTIKNSDLYLQQDALKKLSNPYAGYSMEDALMGMGKFVGGDRSVQNAMGFIKAPLAGARSFMSGQGLAKTEKYAQDEYDRRQREGLVGNYKQDGGVVKNHTFEDTMGYARSVEGIEETEEEILFRRFMEYLEGNKEKLPTLNRQTEEITPEEMRRIEEEKILREHFYQTGGQLTFPERMTGEYVQGIPEDSQEEPSVELEDGEHTLQPDGVMSEVKGKKHNQGGEKLTSDQIEEGSIVVSDHLKIGKDNAKYFRDKYDIKIKAKDTYATVVDKIKSKTGLTKLNKEQEKVIEEVQKQEKGTKDVTTKNINLEFLSQKINELEEEKATVEEVVREALIDVYNVQESEKPEEEQETVVDPDILNQVAQQYDIPEEQAMGIVQEYLKGGKIPKMQLGGGTGPNIYSVNRNIGRELSDTRGPLRRREVEGAYDSNITQEFWKDTENLPQIFQEIGIETFLEDFENKRFIKGEPYSESERKIIQEEIERREAMIDNLDTSIVNRNMLKDVLQQSVGQVYIIQGQATTKEEQGTDEGVKLEAGDTTHNPEHLMEMNLLLNPNISEQERERLLRTTDKNNNRRVLTNIQEDGTGDARPVEIEEATQESRAPSSTVDSGLPFTGASTEINIKPNLKDLQGLVDSLPEVEGTEDKSKGGTDTERVSRNNQDFFAFPDQSVSPPNSMVAPLKGEVRLGRADAFRIDPSQALAQSQRNFDAQMSQIGNLPPAQRQAAQAALLAEKNNADNQIINSIAAQNAQIESGTDRYNLQRSDMEEQLALQNALSYEDRMFRTQAAYDANLDAYYDYMRNLNVARYNDIRNQNMVNSIYENYQINPDGTIGVKPDSERFFELNRMLGQNKNKNNE